MPFRAALFLLLVQLAAGATWHVSPEPLVAIPAAQQRRTINEAAAVVRPGDVVMIHAGLYREAVTVTKSGTPERPIRFEAAPNARVTLTGADEIADWQDEGDGVYSVPWPHRFLPWTKSDAHPDNEYHRLIGRTEQVFADNYPLHQTLTRETLSRGSFFVDFDAQRLFIVPPTGEAPGGNLGRPIIQASSRAVVFDCQGAYVQLRGLRFRYAANHAQQGAVSLSGRGDLLEDCTIEQTSGAGAVFLAEDQVARRCTFQDHGAIGIAATRAHNLLVTECVIRNNNTKGFSRDWEAGGAKIVLSRNVLVERSQFLSNRGPGVWFDIGNEACAVRNCLVAENEGAGIYCEISYGLHALDNVVIGNGLAPDPRAWGVQAGISISSSPDCVVQRNLLVANREGFSFREQRRTTPRIEHDAEEPVWNQRETITNNVIADNHDAQIGGWFDAGDERNWPRAMQETTSDGLSLEQLEFRFAKNLFATTDGQPLVAWGATWRRHVAYSNLRDVQGELQFEQGSRIARVQFANFAAHDYRLAPGSAAFEMGCYPEGEIPGVTLGALGGSERKPARDRLKNRQAGRGNRRP
ncbi:MAG: right-handed parallel beta-helix repeat-containing protein [Verrucomicrobiota bacterium]|nr:right-handed parallel beta-helix repeat-containing protein [Verrucomicrobiota bacterium]